MGDRRRYWLGFSLVVGIGPTRLKRLLEAFGEIERAWHAPPQALRAAGLSEKLIGSLVEIRERIDLEAELERVEQAGFQVVTWESAQYPRRLSEIASPPPMLYVWGDLRAEDRLAVAIVGTRRPTPYGMAVAREVAAAMAVHGVTVVSGLARGIDRAAHEAALEAGGRTLAVLGSGLDEVYPPEHRGLAQRIAAQGAVVSDYPLGTRPEAGNFPPRNRIISGLSLAVVVVEAGASSGALITAHFAAEQGRDVLAVPGNITSRASRGCNRLIRDGAMPLTSVDDLLEVLNLDVVARQESAAEQLPEEPDERKVYQALAGEPVHVDELGARCGMPIARVTAALAMLELKGRVRQVGGMQFMRVREGRAGYRVE